MTTPLSFSTRAVPMQGYTKKKDWYTRSDGTQNTSLMVTIVGERERSNQQMCIQVLKVLQSLIGQLAGEVEVEVAVLACCM